MADGIDIYLASLGLAKPAASYVAGADVAAQHQKILMAQDAQNLDYTMKLLDNQQKARQAQATNDIAQQRLALTAQQNSDRNSLEAQRIGAMGQNLTAAWTPPPPMPDEQASAAMQAPSATSPGADQAELALQASQQPPVALGDAPAGTTTDDTSSYAPGTVMPDTANGPLVPGGNSLPLANGRMPYEAQPDTSTAGPMQPPTDAEAQNLGGGLLPSPAPDQASLMQRQAGQEKDGTIRSGPDSWYKRTPLPDGTFEVQHFKWDGRNGGHKVAFGSPRVEKGSGEVWNPPITAPGEPPVKGVDQTVTNLGSGIGSKIVSANGLDQVQEMAWNGKPPDKGGAWKPRGVPKTLPKVTQDGDLPEAKVMGNVTIIPLPKDKGGYTWKTIQTPPDVQTRIDALKAQGFEPDKVTDAGNGRIAIHGVKMIEKDSKAVDGSLTKLVGSLPAIDRSAAAKSVEILLDPASMKDADKKVVLPTADEKAAAVGKKPERMTADDWKQGYAAVMQKRREAAAVDLANRLNTYHTGNNKGYTPKTAQYWLHYADSIMSHTDGSAPPSQPAPAAPAGPAPVKPFNAHDLNGMGITPPDSMMPTTAPPPGTTPAPAPSGDPAEAAKQRLKSLGLL